MSTDGNLTVGGNTTTTGTFAVSGATTLATTTFSGNVDFGLKELKNVVLEKLGIFPSSPVQGQMFYSTASSSPYTYNGSQWKGDVSGATFVVAASNSLNKENADYICDGTADDVQIQAALDALPTNGGKVQLLEGTYTIATTITTTASSTLSGVGWGTVLDVSGISSTNNAITMSDNTVLSDLKIIGDISTLDIMGRKVLAGNNSSINNIWIDNNNYGVDTVNKNNVHINDSRFTNLRGSNGWAAAIHSSGTAKNIFINGVYISDSDRGIEIEDGASNVFASQGSMYNVYPTSGSQNYTFTLDAHSHEDGGGVDNVHYTDFYMYNSGGITSIRSSGSNLSDIPTNINFTNITIEKPWEAGSYGATLGAIGTRLRNIKFVDIDEMTGPILAIAATADNVLLEGIDFEDKTTSFGITIVPGAGKIVATDINMSDYYAAAFYIAGAITSLDVSNFNLTTSQNNQAFIIASGVSNIQVNNGIVSVGGLAALSGTNSNIHFSNITMTGFTSNIISTGVSTNNISLRDMSLTPGSSFTASGSIELRGSNNIVSNVKIYNAKGNYGIYTNGDNNIVENSYVDFDDSSPASYGYGSGNGNANYRLINNLTHDTTGAYAVSIQATSGIVKGNYFPSGVIWFRSSSSNVKFIDNILGDSVTIIDEGINNKVYDNQGYNTATSSTATITSGNTYVVVTHLLDITPATSTVSIIPLEDLGNASTTNFWISDVGASTFRINVGIDPGKDVDFSWNIGSY